MIRCSETQLCFLVLVGIVFYLSGLPLEASIAGEKWQVRPAIVVGTARVDASCLVGSLAPVALREALAKVPLGLIANPLGELVLEKPVLLQLLGSLANRVDLPNIVQVRRRGDLLSGSELEVVVRRRCLERFPEREHGRVEIDISRLPTHVVLPGALQDWDVKPMSQNALGMVLFNLEAHCDGGKIRQIVQVEVWKTVEAAKIMRLARPGEVLTAGDLERVTMKIRNTTADQYPPLEEIVGKTLASYKSAGTMIRRSDTRDGTCNLVGANMPAPLRGHSQGAISSRPGVVSRFEIQPVAVMAAGKSSQRESWVVAPGEQVEFAVSVNGLNLTVPAKAVEGGGVGDAIRLINLQNQRPIKGRIMAKGKVAYAEN